MTWSLSASGHTPAPEGENDWAEVEQELHAELHKVLSNPKYGTTYSQFGGNHVTGDVHIKHVTVAEDETKPDATV